MKLEKRVRVAQIVAAVGVLLVLSPGPASASDTHWRIGGGAGYRPDYEGSNDYEPFPIGFFRMDWDSGPYIALRGTESAGAAVRLEGNILANDSFQIGPVLQYRLKRGDVTSGRVDAMNTVDPAIEIGGFAAYKVDAWLLRTTVAGDVSGEHDGTLVELLGGYEQRYDSNVSVELHLASTWASDGYMGTYFNVTQENAARSGFQTYDADAGFKDVGTRLAVGWGAESWGPWRVFGIFSYYRMLGDAEDSPLVDDAGNSNQFFGGIAVGYSS